MSFWQKFALCMLLVTPWVGATDNIAMEIKPGNAKAGEAKAAACAACHGVDGNSSSAQYPKLAGQHENYTRRQLQLFKSGQRENPIMLGFSTPLAEQDMRDIGAFFATKQILPGVTDEKLLARGSTLYRGGDKTLGIPACMACHGPDGRGNPSAGYPQLAGQYADYTVVKLNEWHEGKTWSNDEHAKIMPTIAQRLSPGDIVALASYIEGLHTAESSSTTK